MREVIYAAVSSPVTLLWQCASGPMCAMMDRVRKISDIISVRQKDGQKQAPRKGSRL